MHGAGIRCNVGWCCGGVVVGCVGVSGVVVVVLGMHTCMELW